jgi:hypothetical protein
MKLKLLTMIAAATAALSAAQAQTYTDNFSTPINYLTNGVAGTIWDGIYLGAGEFAGETDLGMAPGTVSIADASISSNGVLTVSSLQTDWEQKSDDGFFLFKVVNGDFDMSVRIVGPIDTHAHNFPGLMVRAFGPSGAPAPGGQENYLIWGRFDEYNSIPNMLKNNTNGAKRDTPRGTWPNTNYWLRIQRTTNVFTVFEKDSATNSWTQMSTVTRNDFVGRPLQVGIEHADYDGGRMLKAAYSDFSLTVAKGLNPAAPSPVTNLKVDGKGSERGFTWTPGNGNGTLLVVWTGSAVLKAAPANGTTYEANGEFGQGGTLPSTNYFVVYVGSGKEAAVTGLKPATYRAAAFSRTGPDGALVYSHVPAIVDFKVEP